MRKIVLMMIMSLFLFQNIFAWNVTDFQRGNESVEEYENYSIDQDNLIGHQWITRFAYNELKKRGIKFRALNDDTLKYVLYGGKFADEPWIGRPEAPGKEVEGVMDEYIKLNNKAEDYFLYNHDREYFHESDYFYGHVQTRFRNRNFEPGYDKPNKRSNTYMEVDSHYYVRNVTTQDIKMAADNYFHFPSSESDDNVNVVMSNYNKDLYDNPIPDIEPSAGWNWRVYQGSDVGMKKYGKTLFNLSRKFWSVNNDGLPIMSDFVYASNCDESASVKTGTAVLDSRYKIYADFPSTYLGGQPFICWPDSNFDPSGESCQQKDLCYSGNPTWPIWVPENYSEVNDELIKYQAELKKEQQSKNNRVALIYLGWALHMIQDMAMPAHAYNISGNAHSLYEELADEQMADFDATVGDQDPMEYLLSKVSDRIEEYNRQTIEDIFGTVDNPISNKDVCRFVGIYDASGNFSENGLLNLFGSVELQAIEQIDSEDYSINVSKLYKFLNMMDDRDEIRYSIYQAIKFSMILMACIQPDMDDDHDGIDNDDDNCIDDFNPDQNNWNGGPGDACQDSSGDGWMDDMSACPNLDMRKYFPDMAYAFNNQTVDITTLSCRRSTDQMCVEIRSVSDYCDMDGDGRWDLEPEDEYEIDEYAYSASGYWSKLGQNIKIENCRGISCTGTQEIGHKLSISQRASYFCGQDDTESKLSTYFCYCGNTSILHGKCYDDGGCGKDHANPNEVWDYAQGHETWQPVFSEFPGIDTESESCWKSGGNFDKIKGLSKSKEWDYRNDKYLKELLTDDDLSVHEDGESVRQSGNYTMLKLAQGVVTGSASNYVTTTDANGHELNRNYFSNYNQTHVLNDKSRLILAKKNSEYVDIITEKVSYLRIRVNPADEGYGKWWYDMMRDYLGIKPWDDPEWKWEYGFEDTVKNSIYESVSRPSEFSKVGFDGNSINLESVSFKDDYNQIFSFGGRDAAYFMKDGVFSIAFTDVNGIFNDVSPVAYGIEMRSAAVVTSGTEIFMAAGFKEVTARTASDNSEQMPARSANFSKISFSDNGAYMTVLSPLPWEPVHISLFEIAGNVHAVMTDGNGTGEILAYNSGNDYWEKLTDLDFGMEFSLNNTFVKGNELYFTAPGPNGQNTLYSWSSGSGINEVASLELSYDAFIKPLSSGEKTILADFRDISGGIRVWELNEEGFTPVTMEIETPQYEKKFCIRENDGSIFPGATNHRGECISVYDYNYQTVSYFDYKLTVAGYGSSLYLGGLTGIRRVEIKEDGTLKNREMLYTGETNNLAVYKNTLYGADYGEVDVYSISDNGSISRIRGISSSSCGNVRISNDRLFTAENKKVKIYDLTDPQNPQLIKTISTSGKVIDIEVVGEKLYIYEEKTSWFITKGYTGIYDISDINLPVRTQYFEKRCRDAEMQKSGETIYLGCKNGQFRVEDTGLAAVSGEKNYVREGYAHDGVLYQVFSGALHKSKTSGIQLECGNGMIEPGEICDSDTLQCSELDTDYVDGTASCNSTCSGYNESSCETDGW